FRFILNVSTIVRRRILLVSRPIERLRFRSMPRTLVVFRAVAALLALCVVAPWPHAAAHDIPNDATVQMFFKPDGKHLSVLVRVPLKTMRDVEFPEREQGYIDLARVDQ